MDDRLPSLIEPDAPIFVISVAARLAGMHPQTLRSYDRLGLVSPRRSRGRGRRYSPRDVAKLRLVQQLSQEEGINLNGIRRILTLQDELDSARRQLELMVDVLRVNVGASPRPRVFVSAADGEVNWSEFE